MHIFAKLVLSRIEDDIYTFDYTLTMSELNHILSMYNQKAAPLIFF